MRPRNDLWHFSGTREAALAVLLFLYMPIVALVAMSFNVGDSLTIWSGFGVRWYGVFRNN